MSDNGVGVTAIFAGLALAVTIAVGFVSCERSKHQAFRECVAAGNEPAECALATRVQQ